MSAFTNDPIEVRLGERAYKVRPLKWKRLLPMKKALSDLLRELNTSLNFGDLIREFTKENGNPALSLDKIEIALDQVVYTIAPVMKLAIPDLDERIFAEDAEENDSPDIGQVVETFDAILKANRLEAVKNLLAGRQDGQKPTTSS